MRAPQQSVSFPCSMSPSVPSLLVSLPPYINPAPSSCRSLLAFVSYNEKRQKRATAARPTWATAKGGNEQGGARIFAPPPQKYSSRGLASHTTLKPREEGQGTQDELPKKNLRKELEEQERRHFASKAKSYAEDRDRRKGGQVLWKEQGEKLKIELFRVIMMLMILMQKSKMMQRVMAMLMMTRMIKALLAELERIKKEQAKEKLNKERRQQAEALKDKEAELMPGNPLININNSSSFNVKRWDDDVVFKNKTHGETKAP